MVNTQEAKEKSKQFMRDWRGVLFGFVLALATTIMSIIDFSSIESGNIFKELSVVQYTLIAISVAVKGVSNMFIFRVFIKSGIDLGKKDEEYQNHLDYQDEQVTKCLPYKKELDILCEQDNFKSLQDLMMKYCNHNRLVFNDVINEDLSLKEDYIPKNKKEAKAIKRIYKDCSISEVSTELLFDVNVGGWQKNKDVVLEKEYLSKNSSTAFGMVFSALTSILSVAPFFFSISGLLMAVVNFGIIVGMAWYKRMKSISYSKDDLGGEIKRRGLKLEMFYFIIQENLRKEAVKNQVVKEKQNNGIIVIDNKGVSADGQLQQEKVI